MGEGEWMGSRGMEKMIDESQWGGWGMKSGRKACFDTRWSEQSLFTINLQENPPKYIRIIK